MNVTEFATITATSTEISINELFRVVELFFELQEYRPDMKTERLCEQVKEFVKMDKSFIKATNSDGMTLLHIAAKNSDATFIDCLLAKGADANDVDKNGNTPLHIVIS